MKKIYISLIISFVLTVCAFGTTYFQQGVNLFNKKNYQAARVSFSQAINVNNYDLNARYYYAVCSVRMGDKSSAISEFQTITKRRYYRKYRPTRSIKALVVTLADRDENDILSVVNIVYAYVPDVFEPLFRYFPEIRPQVEAVIVRQNDIVGLRVDPVEYFSRIVNVRGNGHPVSAMVIP